MQSVKSYHITDIYITDNNTQYSIKHELVNQTKNFPVIFLLKFI